MFDQLPMKRYDVRRTEFRWLRELLNPTVCYSNHKCDKCLCIYVNLPCTMWSVWKLASPEMMVIV